MATGRMEDVVGVSIAFVKNFDKEDDDRFMSSTCRSSATAAAILEPTSRSAAEAARRRRRISSSATGAIEAAMYKSRLKLDRVDTNNNLSTAGTQQGTVSA